MHYRWKTLLVFLNIAAVLAHDSSTQGFPRRKTIGFGPILPHAKFTTSPEDHLVASSSSVDSSEPFEIARTFVDGLMGPNANPEISYTIRDDSYTDDATGITHVYVKQIVQGLEVVDAHINLNIKDGRVISYGDTFYRGSTEDNSSHSPQEAYCQSFMEQLQAQREQHNIKLQTQSSQMPMGLHETGLWDHGVLEHIYNSNCDMRHHSVRMGNTLVEDPRTASLMFMIAATPSSGLANNIASNFDDYLSKVTVSPSHSLHGDGPAFMLSGVPDTVNPVKAHLAYAQVPDDHTISLRLVWKLEVEMEDNWYEASVDALQPSNIVAVVDWTSDSPLAPVPTDPSTKGAVYNVFSWGLNDPLEGERSMQAENVDSLASPYGWHAVPSHNAPWSEIKNIGAIVNYTTTAGNNVFAHENWEGRNNWLDNYRPDAGHSRVFDYAYAPTSKNGSDPMKVAKSYINATVTQLFYTTNMLHDLYYRYGFDEKSGNFQQYNFGRGGRENDAVIANAQDGSGFNNANFVTPPDGQNGRCRMYLWNTASPYRDGDLEAGIVIHELSHGLSTRLTGGPMNSGCLGWGESGGMGEGWGDYLATTIRSKEVYQDYAMGSWASNRPNGIRNYIYSTNMTVNPSTYKTLDKPGYWGVHAIGEVWAEMLWVTSQIIIEKYGYSDTLFPPKPDANGTISEGDFYRPAQYDATGKRKPLIPKHGNTLMFQLVINAMKLQPCSPGFLEARDAVIQADDNLTGGENFCLLWRGFASRGLGRHARVDGRTPWGGGIRTNDYSVPLNCDEDSSL